MISAIFASALALNPGVTQGNLHATVCTVAWTQSVRPPASYTDALKRQQLAAGQSPRDFEEDHVTPLCAGGAPRDPRNLRPQPWPEARRKDQDERATCRAICTGRITLKAGQLGLAARWPR